VWCDLWRVSGRRPAASRFGARGRTLDDVLEAARDGRAVGLVPASIARSQNWPGLAFVEVTDIPESEIAVAWRSSRQSPLVAEFVGPAEELGDRRSALKTTA
jgi:DNA-binding transcriptional LysR family regulator